MKIHTFNAILLLLLPAAAFADLAPSVYNGTSIAPATNTDISMREEVVDIFVRNAGAQVPYRYICDVRADFIMENSTDRRIDILVGFPVQQYDGEMKLGAPGIKDDIFRFSAKADGVPIDSISTSAVRLQFFNRSIEDWLWFGWMQSFDPGTTRIEVEYSFVTTPAMVYSASTMGYSLYSGSFWKGPIGRARIVVHFPRKMDGEFLSEIAPAGYVIDGDRVLWDLKDFEPGINDNVGISFMQFELIEKMEKARSIYTSDPDEAANKTGLAEACLMTESTSGKYFRPSWDICWTRSEDFERQLKEIEDEEDRALVASIFKLEDRVDGSNALKYYIRDNEKEFDLSRLEKILIDFRFKDSLWNGIDYMKQAEKLILEVLDEDPQNCYVWNLYLSHFFKILPGTWGPTNNSMRNEIMPLQRDLIEKACKCCPEDSGIALWKDLLDGVGPDFPDAIQFIEEAGDYLNLWYMSPPRGHLGGRKISPEDKSILFIMFEPGDTVTSETFIRAGEKCEMRQIYLKLRKEPVPENIKKSIREMLHWNGAISALNGNKIREYNESKGIY